MPIVTVDGIPYKVPRGMRLGDLLAREGHIGMPCGGHGRCGKCKVLAAGKAGALSAAEEGLLSQEERRRGIRLACLARVEGDCAVRLAAEGASRVRLEGEMPEISPRPDFRAYGAAVDLGTTTLAARLYDAEGKLLAASGCPNPQGSWGADVISRIEAALDGGQAALARAVRGAVDGLLADLLARAGIQTGAIDGMVVTGNTVMLHLLTDTCVEPLSHAPFGARRLFGESLSAGALGLAALPSGTECYLPPCAAAFVGADLITALLASGICEASETRLLADIGTNGEMALWHRGRLALCSTAAGPAFEGAGISCGMAGKRGAIDRVEIRDGRLEAHVIGGTQALGICGSGVVDAAACLLETGRLEETGYLEEESAMLAPGVFLTQKDIRMVQLAKGAIHAGIRTLCHRSGVAFSEVSGLLIAGGFGSWLNVENAGKIGLIPGELAARTRVLGNAALDGASMLLLDPGYRGRCGQYAAGAALVELSGDPFFAENYLDSLSFGEPGERD